MTEPATIRAAIAYVTGVFEQVALLFQAADDLLAPHGFGKVGVRNIVDTAATLAEPRKWMPDAAFRFYVAPEKAPRVLLFVTVLFDDRGDEYQPMPECLLTAGAFIHRGKMWREKQWDHWWARWHGFNDERRDDGTVRSTSPDDWPDDKTDYPFERLLTVGVPLPTITTTAQLDAFLTPLLRELAPHLARG